MALPEFRAVGAKASGTTAEVEVGPPAGIATGDLELLVATTIAGGTVTIPSAGGGAWTAVPETPVDVTGGEKLYAWYRERAGGDSNPKVKAATDHVCSGRFAWKAGTFDKADPFEVEKNGTETTSDTSFNFAPGNETGGVDRVCIVICSSGEDSNTGQAGTDTANSSLTAINLRAEYQTNSGGGGGFWLADAYRATAGTVGTWTQTMVSATPKAYVSLVLKPTAAINSRYKLKETEGTVVDDDLGGADGEYFGSPSLNQTGITKSGDPCPNFDGVNDRIAIPDIIGTWTGFTGKLWVKPSTLAFHQLWGWAGSTAAPGAWLTEAGKIKCDIAAAEGGTVTLESTSTYKAEDLLCIHVTYFSGRFRLYVNGVKEKESTTPKGAFTGGAGIIGVNSALSSGWLKGKLAYLEFQDNEYSEAEVLAEFEAEKPTEAQKISITSATETDTAQALSHKKPINKTATPATETDTAQPLSVKTPIVKSITSATETDTAQSLSHKKPIVKSLGVATETVIAQSMQATKKVALTPASEIDAAQSLVVIKKIIKAITAAVESDVASPLSLGKHKTLGVVPETDTAQVLNVVKKKILGVVTELDTAQPLSFKKPIVKSLGQALEANSAMSLSFLKKLSLSPAIEVDAAQALSRVKKIALTAAAETDSAQSLNTRKTISLTPAVETDTAQALSYIKQIRKSLGPVIETDTAQALSFQKTIVKALAAVVENDLALPFGTEKKFSLGVVNEIDSAVSLLIAASLSLSPAQETDVAQALVREKHLSLGSATESDLAISLLHAKKISILSAGEIDVAMALSSPSLLEVFQTVLNTTATIVDATDQTAIEVVSGLFLKSVDILDASDQTAVLIEGDQLHVTEAEVAPVNATEVEFLTGVTGKVAVIIDASDQTLAEIEEVGATTVEIEVPAQTEVVYKND